MSGPKPAPRAPAGLDKAGAAWWKAVSAEYELMPGDSHLVESICRALDIIESCRVVTKRDGVSTVDRHGQVRVHPLLVEERLQREMIRRSLATLRLPVEEPA